MEAGLPNITAGWYGESAGAEGALYDGGTFNGKNVEAGGSIDHYVKFDARRCSEVYGNSDTVQPNALTTRYYMKY